MKIQWLNMEKKNGIAFKEIIIFMKMENREK
jgi:hypothetical protein